MGKVALVYMMAAEGGSADGLEDLTDVEVLSDTATDEGSPVPAGTHGTIVGVWGDGAYEVEFAPSIVGLATIPGKDLRAIGA